MRKIYSRIAATLMAAVMVFCALPATILMSFAVNAEETPSYLMFATDRHGSTSCIKTMLGNVSVGSQVEYFGLGGDMVDNQDNYNTSTILTEVQSVATNASVDIIQGSHDTGATDDAKIMCTEPGLIETGDDYYVYGIPQTYMENASYASDAADDFVTWANGSDVDKSKVIILLSHMPLHQRRNDNDGASYWASAMNSVAVGNDTTIDRDIIFFWGHNHTQESSADTAVYHVAPGGTISVQGGSSSQTIYFTYANAGYLNKGNKEATLLTITDSTVTFTKYTNSGASYSTTGTVTRVVQETTSTVTPKTLAVTCESQYYVGDSLKDPSEIVVTYSDETEQTLSGGDLSLDNLSYEVTDADGNEVSEPFTTAGEYTVTYTYKVTIDGKTYEATAPKDITVSDVTTENTVSCFDDSKQVEVEATAIGLTAVTATNITGNVAKDACDKAFTANGYVTLDIALTGHTTGNSVDYSISVVPDLDTTNLELYYIDSDGNLIPVEYTLTEDELGNVYVEFTTTYVGTFVYGSAAVPEGYVASDITIENVPADLFVGDGLDLTDAVITVTYTKEGEEDFVRVLTVWDYDEYNFDLDVYTAGEQTVTFTFDDATETFTVHVWQEVFTDDATKVEVDVEDFGSTELNVKESENTHVADATKAVLKEGTYVAYDITLKGFENGDKATVTLPIPEGVTTPVVYYVSDDGEIVTNMCATNNGNGTVSFETTHFSTYVVGESAMVGVVKDDTVPGQTGVTTYTSTPVTVYKLVASPVSGKQYLIVNSANGTGYGLDGDTTGYATTAFTGGSNYYSTWDSTNNTGTAFAVGSDVYLSTSGAYLWTAGSSTFTIGYTRTDNGGDWGWLTGGNYSYTLNPAGDGGAWTVSSNQLKITLQATYTGLSSGSNTNADYYLTNSGSTWGMATSGAANVYFYEPVTVYEVTTSTTDTPDTTYSMVITYPKSDGTYADTEQALTAAFVQSGETMQLGAQFYGNGTACDAPANGTWYITSSNEAVATVGATTGLVTFTGTEGETLIQATYTWTENGETYSVSNYVAIKVTGAIYTLEIDNGDSHVEKGVTSSSTEQLTATVTVQTSETATSTITSGIKWEILTEESDDGIATIDESTGLLTFTGNEGTIKVQASYTVNGKEYVDDITVIAKKSTAVTPDESTSDFPRWPNEGAVRFDKTATAVGNFSETGIAQVELSMAGIPVKTGGAIDVVLMLDMSNSMKGDPTTNLKAAAKAFMDTLCLDEDGNWNEIKHGVSVISYNIDPEVEYVANTTESYTDDMKDISSYSDYEDVCDAIDAMENGGGTDYAEALAYAYELLVATKDASRPQYLVFMTDGVPTSYAYLATSQKITSSKHTESVIKENVYTSGTDVYNAYLVDQGTGTGSSYELDASNLIAYDEYYSYLMKQNGVEIYSVGLSISDSDCKTLISHISSAGEDETTTADNSHTFFMSSTDASAIEEAFVNIAKEITKTVTNVEVEDVITAEYDLIFELPNSNIEGLPEGQEFYLEVVDYPLDETTHERTGTSTIKQRIYLATASDGTVYISKIIEADGTTTTYTVDNVPTPVFTAKGEGQDAYFDWTDSDGDGVADAGEYSYKPDGDGTHLMTSGAYVVLNTDGSLQSLHTVNFTYVVATKQLNWTATSMSETSETALRYFVYLKDSGGVDAADQVDPGTYPTNKYATLTYTNVNGVECEQKFPVPQMTWNGAQVSYVFYLVNEDGVPVNRAGREVTFAEAIFVTDIYTYAIVWNDLEQAAGLEAEYLASDKLPDDYRLFDTNASYKIHVYEKETGVNLNNHFIIGGTSGDETTYVYNNKTDVDKYNEHGTYAATVTYLCKGNGTISNVTWSEVAIADASDLVTGAYYYDVDGVKTRALTYVEGTTYYQLTGASYTAETGETQWTPGTGDSTTGGTVIGNYVYYVDENGDVYTIVQKTNATAISGFDFANTTVAFAVVWEKKLVSDTVVVDFGLPVDIDVVSNDFVYNYISGIGATDPDYGINTGYKTDAGALTKQDLTINGHSVKVKDQNHIRFTPGSMEFNTPIEFYYETTVETYEGGKVVPSYMYSSVTVIPATTIYYEDSFVKLTTSTKNEDGTYTTTDGWTTIGTTISATQDQDRPGESQISADIDADNLYGYDSAYENMSQYSMGSAAMVNVYSGKYANAEFTFYGTGFDIISMTDTTTGTILVDIYTTTDGGTTWTLSNNYYAMVDTYYGYAYGDDPSTTEVETDAWYTVDSNDPNALYQVPVIKMEGMTYGYYKVVITVSYMSFMDHTDETGYDFYLDAIRIYDPTGNTNDVANDAYVKDEEGWPVYQELRNNVIAASDFSSTSAQINGAVFVDSNSETMSVTDYVNYGPNNELYLAPGQAVIFSLDLAAYGDTVKSVQLAMKAVDESGATYAILDGETIVDKDDITGAAKTELTTTTDMYYDITYLKDSVIVIYNAGTSGMLSITNVKVTFTAEPGTVDTLYYADYDVIEKVLANANTEPAFTPSVSVAASATEVDKGGYVTVTVTTDTTVETVSIDGSLVATYTVNSEGKRVWTSDVTCDTVGTKTISVIAYNAEGKASETTSTVSVNVTEPTTEEVVAEAVKTVINKLWSSFKSWFNW